MIAVDMDRLREILKDPTFELPYDDYSTRVAARILTDTFITKRPDFSSALSWVSKVNSEAYHKGFNNGFKVKSDQIRKVLNLE